MGRQKPCCSWTDTSTSHINNLEPILRRKPIACSATYTEQPSEEAKTHFPERKSTMAAAAVYGGLKGKLGVEDAPELQLNRIRITLSSKNVKNLEKGITKPHDFRPISSNVI
jgi:hypothetical protein